ncbi:hypothetical protein LTR27_005064 [Elasticomyces elasticus]|nr:hypothetical protein LTR27_005064 [Elasticomyces elasticus]
MSAPWKPALYHYDTDTDEDESDNEPQPPRVPTKRPTKKAEIPAPKPKILKKAAKSPEPEPDFEERDEAQAFLERVIVLRDEMSSNFESVTKHLDAAYKALNKIIDKYQTIDDVDGGEEPAPEVPNKRKATKDTEPTAPRKSARLQAKNLADMAGKDGETTPGGTAIKGVAQTRPTPKAKRVKIEITTDFTLLRNRYKKWTVTQLKDKCRKYNIAISGNKGQLVKRLQTHDVENGTTPNDGGVAEESDTEEEEEEDNPGDGIAASPNDNPNGHAASENGPGDSTNDTDGQGEDGGASNNQPSEDGASSDDTSSGDDANSDDTGSPDATGSSDQASEDGAKSDDSSGENSPAEEEPSADNTTGALENAPAPPSSGGPTSLRKPPPGSLRKPPATGKPMGKPIGKPPGTVDRLYGDDPTLTPPTRTEAERAISYRDDAQRILDQVIEENIDDLGAYGDVIDHLETTIAEFDKIAQSAVSTEEPTTEETADQPDGHDSTGSSSKRAREEESNSEVQESASEPPQKRIKSEGSKESRVLPEVAAVEDSEESEEE